MDDERSDRGRSGGRWIDRRRFLQSAVGTSLGGVTAASASDGPTGQPDPSEYETLLEGMDGDGTTSDPYVVTDVRELQAIDAARDASYALGADIDATATADWNGGAGFDPIGEFTGAFDGRGHEISGLTIDRPDEKYVGLFSRLEGNESDLGTVRNLSVVDADVEGSDDVGVLAGRASGMTVVDVSVTGIVRGEEDVGGITGWFDARTSTGANATIESCTADCDVRGDEDVGGLVAYVRGGDISYVTVSECIANGPVTGNENVGGLVGGANDIWDGDEVVIEDSVATGDVSAGTEPDARIGGLVGRVENVPVRRCKATGDVDAGDGQLVGGLVGQARDPNSVLESSFATGSVSGSYGVGGLIGSLSHESVRRCYAIGDVSGERSVGGLAGVINNSVLVDSYARGDVVGTEDVGGVLGRDKTVSGSNRIARTYATGAVDGNETVGPVVGDYDGSSIDDAYWDVETTGRATGPGLSPENGASTTDLRGTAAETTLKEFDFVRVWKTVPDGYPTLRSVEDWLHGTVEKASIETVRLVQTVEHTRVLDPDRTDRTDVLFRDAAPVADGIVSGESHPTVSWAAPDPELVAGRLTAPVFDVRVDEPAAVDDPVTLTSRLLDDADDTIDEWTATLAPETVAGRDETRRAKIEGSWDHPLPEQLPMGETIADDPDRIDGEYPIFTAGVGTALELEIDGPDFENPIDRRMRVDDAPSAAVPTLSIGVIGLESARLDRDYSVTFDDGFDITAFAERIARYLLDTFPLVAVDVAVVEGYHSGWDGLTDTHAAAQRAETAMGDAIDDARTVQYLVGGDSRDTERRSVDVTVGVVPPGFFDADTQGVMPTVDLPGDDERPIAESVLVEAGYEDVAAHEVAHYFLGDHFDDENLARNGDDEFHATANLTSTGYDIQDGEFEILPGRTSLLSYTSSRSRWADAHTYQGLIDSQFAPETAAAEGGASGYVSRVLDRGQEQRDRLEAVPEPSADRLPAAVEAVHDRLSTHLEELAAAVDPVEYRWEAPDVPDEEFWNDLEAVGDDLETIGSELQAADERLLADARDRTTHVLGAQLEADGRRLATRAAETADRADDGEVAVELALRVSGRIDEPLDLDVEVVPVLEEPEPVAGDGTIDVMDGEGTVVDSAAVATEVTLIGHGDDPGAVEDAVVGVIGLSDDAAVAEVTVEDEGGDTHSTTVNPTTDPIRKRIEALPDEAFVDPADRRDLLALLEAAGEQIADGNRTEASATLADLRERLADALRDEYETESGGPSRDEVLSIVESNSERVASTDDEDDGSDASATPWIVGGLAAAGGAGYYLKRRLDDPGDEPS